MHIARIDNRTCDECDKEHSVFIELEQLPDSGDFNESWTCPLCGFHNNRFAVPLED